MLLNKMGIASMEEEVSYAYFDEEVRYMSNKVEGSCSGYQGANQGPWRPM